MAEPMTPAHRTLCIALMETMRALPPRTSKRRTIAAVRETLHFNWKRCPVCTRYLPTHLYHKGGSRCGRCANLTAKCVYWRDPDKATERARVYRAAHPPRWRITQNAKP